MRRIEPSWVGGEEEGYHPMYTRVYTTPVYAGIHHPPGYTSVASGTDSTLGPTLARGSVHNDNALGSSREKGLGRGLFSS